MSHFGGALLRSHIWNKLLYTINHRQEASIERPTLGELMVLGQATPKQPSSPGSCPLYFILRKLEFFPLCVL